MNGEEIGFGANRQSFRKQHQYWYIWCLRMFLGDATMLRPRLGQKVLEVAAMSHCTFVRPAQLSTEWWGHHQWPQLSAVWRPRSFLNVFLLLPKEKSQHLGQKLPFHNGTLNLRPRPHCSDQGKMLTGWMRTWAGSGERCLKPPLSEQSLPQGWSLSWPLGALSMHRSDLGWWFCLCSIQEEAGEGN